MQWLRFFKVTGYVLSASIPNDFSLPVSIVRPRERLNPAPPYIGLNDGLVGYWSFDGATVSSIDPLKVNDFSGNGNQGSASGSNIPTCVIGKFGQALDFDGSDYYTAKHPYILC
jgi:hypothetical protein